MKRTPFLLLLAALACLALAPGCAKPRQPAETAWKLSPAEEADYQYLRYLQAFAAGDYQQAADAVARVVELAPSTEMYLNAANAQWRLGNPATARKYIRQGLDLSPGDRRLVSSLADTYLLENRPEAAADVLRQYLADHPEEPTMRRKLARLYIESEKFADALDTLGQLPPEQMDTEARFLKAKANARLGLRIKAINILKTVVENDPENVMAWAELAYLYELENDFVAAEAAYSRLLQMGETGREVWLRLILINLRLNNPDKALALAHEGPQDEDFLLESARLFIDEGFYGQARTLLEPLRSAAPTRPELHFYLSLIAFEGDNDPQQALSHLKGIPKQSPLHPKAMAFSAHLQYAAGDKEQALAMARKGRQEYPSVPDFFEIESWVLEDRGQPEQALEVLEKALAHWPEDEDLLYRKGVLLQKLGREDESLAAMEKIVALNPDHADALNFVGYLLAEQGRDLDRALVMIRRAMELKPDNGYIIDSLAWVLFKRGEAQKAWQHIRHAAALIPEDPTVWEHYGDIAAALGKTKEARTGYEKALDLSSPNAEAIRQRQKAL